MSFQKLQLINELCWERLPLQPASSRYGRRNVDGPFGENPGDDEKIGGNGR